MLLVVIGVLKSLKWLPHSRRYAYAALLIPIALHTQVELPFYISASHWFLFLLLLFIVMQPGRQRFRVGLSLTANQLVKYVSLITAMLSMLFIGHSMAASIEFKNYMLEKTNDSEQPFAIAMQNPYFRPFATQTMMTLLYAKSLRYGIRSNIELFADRVTVELKRNPHIAYYQLAVNAQQALVDSKKACDIAKEAQAIYPRDETLNRTLVKCDKHQG